MRKTTKKEKSVLGAIIVFLVGLVLVVVFEDHAVFSTIGGILGLLSVFWLIGLACLIVMEWAAYLARERSIKKRGHDDEAQVSPSISLLYALLAIALCAGVIGISVGLWLFVKIIISLTAPISKITYLLDVVYTIFLATGVYALYALLIRKRELQKAPQPSS